MSGSGRSYSTACRRGFLLSLYLRSAATISAKPDDSMEMLSDLKMMLRRESVLEGLKLSRKKFNDAATLRTDHVIVVFMLVIMFVVGKPVAEANLAG